MNQSEYKSFKLRKIISVVLFISLILLPVTGLLISIAEEIENAFLLHFSTVLHVLTGISFTVFGVLHTKKNWRVMKTYIKKSPKYHNIKEK